MNCLDKKHALHFKGNLHLSCVPQIRMVASLLFVLQIEGIDKVIHIIGKNPAAF